MPAIILRIVSIVAGAANRHKSRTITIVGRSYRYAWPLCQDHEMTKISKASYVV
jgi:hypothetical protein